MIFEGFDNDGERRTDGVDTNDVKFTNNGDGTWQLDFVNPVTGVANGDGSITFAAGEVSDINLRDGGSVIVYSYNDGTDTYDVV